MQHNQDFEGRWAVDDPHWSGGLIIGFHTAKMAKDYMTLTGPGAFLVRLRAPRFHGPWLKRWKRWQVENDALDE